MFCQNQTIGLLVAAASLSILTGCIVEPNRNNAAGSSAGTNTPSYQSGSSYSGVSDAAEYDRGCADAKNGSYDRSGKAGQAYENGWNSCKNSGGKQQNSGAQDAREYDRGCADAQAGSYDRSGNAGQAYENGWNSCKRQ